jgi:hypothetical protein
MTTAIAFAVEAEATADTSCRVRWVPTPVTEPPYDDELPGGPSLASVSPDQLLLALSFQLPGGLPAVPTLRLVPAPSEDEDKFFDPQQTSPAVLPNPRMFAARLVQAMLEVVVAARPLAQLVRWTNDDVYRQLSRRVRIAGYEDATTRRSQVPGRVRSVHVAEPRDNIVEACAIVQCGPRSTAVALRLEGIDGRWQCTALQFG